MASPRATSIPVPDVALDNSDKVGVISSTIPDTVLPSRAVHSATSAPATSAPAGFKIVKVRKPDGTIVKVRRPIKQDADGQSPSTTAPKTSTTIPSEAPIEKPAKLATPKIEPKIHSEQQVGIQEKMSADQTLSLASTQTKTTEAKLKPKSQSTGNENPTHSVKSASRLATPAKTYKLYRTMHKMQRNFSRTISAFDSNGDMGDADDDISDMKSGDDEVDDGSDTPSSDDDSDNNSTDDERNHESNSRTHEKSDSGPKTLPPAPKTGHSSIYSSTITPRRIEPDIKASTRVANGTSEKGTKAGIQINEKEIQPNTTTKSHQHTPRNLKRHSTISQCVI
ncbi:hypothetical protein MMC27_005824 [Xylographa pallens]|nr:hypothetical protein [Xylographa pallens]